MLERSSTRYLLLLYLSDILATLLSLTLANWLRFQLPFGRPPTPFGLLNAPIYAIVAIIWSAMFVILSAYNPKRILSVISEVQTVTTAILLSLLVLAGVLFLTYRGLSRLLLGYFFLLDLFTVLLLRSLLRMIFKALVSSKVQSPKVLIIGAGKVGQDLARKLSQRSWIGPQVIGYLDDDPAKLGQTFERCPVLDVVDKAPQVIQAHGVEEVIIALPLWAYEKMRNLVAALQQLPVNIKVVPDFFALTFFSATLEDLDGIPLIGLKEPVIRGLTRVAKRLMDLVVSMIAIIVLSPLMLVIAILIRLDSEGPAIFTQDRAGENGRLFRMFKFRTMYLGAEKEEQSLLTQTEEGQLVFNKRPDDPRVTRLGRFLRRTSLDELPQLFNVLKGEMSVVGPRPELPLLVQLYQPWQRKRFGVPQGLTGWWQVNDRSDKPMHLHTEDDLYYIQNYSLLLDLKIMWRTLWAVFKGKGAY